MTRLFLRPLILAIFLAIAPAGAPAGEGGIAFVGGIEDLPLMPGLGEVADTGMAFDTPAGRIVEAFARGPVSRAQVMSFYGATLPQLGWSPVGATRFRREGETLELHFPPSPGAAGHLTVRFALTPDATGGSAR
jgi:hypothetical protein